DTLSTSDRDALTPKLGTILYHKDTGVSQWEQGDGTAWVEFGGSVEWGNITGTLSDQTDLQDELDLKANDDDVVHKTGNETIAGTKTFNTGTNPPNIQLIYTGVGSSLLGTNTGLGNLIGILNSSTGRGVLVTGESTG